MEHVLLLYPLDPWVLKHALGLTPCVYELHLVFHYFSQLNSNSKPSLLMNQKWRRREKSLVVLPQVFNWNSFSTLFFRFIRESIGFECTVTFLAGSSVKWFCSLCYFSVVSDFELCSSNSNKHYNSRLIIVKGPPEWAPLCTTVAVATESEKKSSIWISYI